MSEGRFTCVNCQLQFDLQTNYKDHYKSQHHRYNVKRKLIGMPPLSYNDYFIQFQTEQSSKSQSQSEIFCQVCSKKFMSPQTYKQHINSQKHKLNRKQLIHHPKRDHSETSSLSEFQVIGEDEVKTSCLFCEQSLSEDHLWNQHYFPPFKDQCINLKGLINLVKSIVQKGKCIYCQNNFGCQQSVKQHMVDVGHCRLDLQLFSAFQPFYLWKINQSSEEQDHEQEEIEVTQIDDSAQEFQALNKQTLESLEIKRLNRIKHGLTAVTINGKEVGYRSFRQYYKQYLTRKIQPVPRENTKSLPFSQQWKNNLKYLKPKAQFDNLVPVNNHR